jgi:hypothetical protein
VVTVPKVPCAPSASVVSSRSSGTRDLQHGASHAWLNGTYWYSVTHLSVPSVQGPGPQSQGLLCWNAVSVMCVVITMPEVSCDSCTVVNQQQGQRHKGPPAGCCTWQGFVRSVCCACRASGAVCLAASQVSTRNSGTRDLQHGASHAWLSATCWYAVTHLSVPSVQGPGLLSWNAVSVACVVVIVPEVPCDSCTVVNQQQGQRHKGPPAGCCTWQGFVRSVCCACRASGAVCLAASQVSSKNRHNRPPAGCQTCLAERNVLVCGLAFVEVTVCCGEPCQRCLVTLCPWLAPETVAQGTSSTVPAMPG